MLKILNILEKTLSIVPCHRLPKRSIFIQNQKFPICSRCMSILLGYFFIPILFLFPISISILIGILFNVPMIIDGVTQALKWRKSNNGLRIITGLLSGLGQSIIIVWSVRYIVFILS